MITIELRSWTTYELAKQVQRSLGWFWPRAERKLYDEPKRLVAAGLATATEERTGNRPRTVYSITEAGRAALRDWLGSPSARPVLEFEAMVRVFFADGGTIEQLRATLDDVETTALGRLSELRMMLADVDTPDPRYAARADLNALAMRFHLDHEQLVARWAAWAKEQVATWHSPTDPGAWDRATAVAG